MILTFSHIVTGQRIPLTDAEGRELSLSVTADNKSDAINSQAVKDFIATHTEIDLRVRGVS